MHLSLSILSTRHAIIHPSVDYFQLVRKEDLGKQQHASGG